MEISPKRTLLRTPHDLPLWNVASDRMEKCLLQRKRGRSGLWRNGSSSSASVSTPTTPLLLSLNLHLIASSLFLSSPVFPLCWLFGSFLLLSGFRKLNAQAQLEENESRNTKFEFDTPMSSRIYSHNETVAQRIAQEILWSKRCAWAFAALVAICIGTFAVLKALGM